MADVLRLARVCEEKYIVYEFSAFIVSNNWVGFILQKANILGIYVHAMLYLCGISHLKTSPIWLDLNVGKVGCVIDDDQFIFIAVL